MDRLNKVPSMCETGKGVWCRLRDAPPDVLRKAGLYQSAEVRRKLTLYEKQPSMKLAGEIADHMIRAETAQGYLAQATTAN